MERNWHLESSEGVSSQNQMFRREIETGIYDFSAFYLKNKSYIFALYRFVAEE